jgi:hypothetical protein
MPKSYVTFGQKHVHKISDETYDKYCVAVIECDNAVHGKILCKEYFGDQYSMCYHEVEFTDIEMQNFYRRGLIEVDHAKYLHHL